MSAAGAAVRRGNGTAVFLIHGNGVDHRNLLPLDAAFAQVGGFERIYLDLPGFGGTDPLPAPGGLADHADWLEDQVRLLAGPDPFAILGQSMGALLAQELADRLPYRILGLGLLAPVVYPQAAQRSVPPRRVLYEEPGLLQRLEAGQRAAYAQLSVLRDAENWQRFGRHVLPGINAASLRAMARLAKAYDLDPLPVRRAEIRPFPVTVICARQDHVVGYRDAMNLRRRYERFRPVLIERAGHNLHIDQPQRVGRAVADWLRDVKRYRDEVSA